VAFTFKLPDIGEGVAEAEIVKWLVAVGDTVAEDQPLVEVLTDKATVEIPSPRAGVITQLGGAEGAIVPVGNMLVEIEASGGAAGAPTSAPAHAAPQAAPTTAAPAAASAPAATATAAPPARLEAVPAARQLAKERGLDLAAIAGTGPNGRILLADVKRVLEAGEGAPGPATHVPGGSGPEERVPLRGMRRKIAEHMTLAARTVPHFTFVAEADMSAVVAHRKAALAKAEAEGVKLTYVAYVVAALLPALRKYPLLNASLDEAAGEIVLKKHYDIGIATATDEGLTVPVIHGADRLGLFALAKEIDRLATGAREKKLALADLTGGTFTVTTTGAKGGLLATPIVHHPQVAILGVHAIVPRAVVKGGQIVACEMTNLSLSLDHRVVDGQVGADFLYDVIANLEHPEQLGAGR
jgi:pyruvate dehydrogenase E2 component (dihydrolipoamide acetyltransferase)